VIRTVLAKWLWDSRRFLLGWTLAIVVVGCGYAAFWPTFEDPEIAALMENYPSALLEAINYTEITTPAGYLSATVYGLVVAVLMLVFSVTVGTRVVAGEEEAGTLDLTLSHPVSRRSLALQRVGAFVLAVLGIVTVFWVAILVVSGPAHFDTIPAGRLAAMHLHLAAFAVLFGTLTFAVGAATGRRAAALAVGAGAGVLGYAMSGLLPQVDGLEWVRDWSPFTWLNGSQPLAEGLDPGDLAIMLGLSVVFVLLGTLAFERRDLAV
jgi:ABC-2 type transport system permease protein